MPPNSPRATTLRSPFSLQEVPPMHWSDDSVSSEDPAMTDPGPPPNPPFAQVSLAKASVEQLHEALHALNIPTTTFTPFAPHMGGLDQISASDIAIWTGGKPNIDWTALDPKAPTVPKGPIQFHSSAIGTTKKSYVYRYTGHTTNALITYIPLREHVWEDLMNTGMDTIAYMPDPVDKTHNQLCS